MRGEWRAGGQDRFVQQVYKGVQRMRWEWKLKGGMVWLVHEIRVWIQAPAANRWWQ